MQNLSLRLTVCAHCGVRFHAVVDLHALLTLSNVFEALEKRVLTLRDPQADACAFDGCRIWLSLAQFGRHDVGYALFGL